MFPHFVDFINPITDERFVVALRQLDGEKLIQKYYPQLHFVLFSIPNDNFTKVADFILTKIGVKALKEGMDTLFPISQVIYKGQLNSPKEVNKYILDSILKLTAPITAKVPNWNYIQKASTINVYKMIFSAISQKDPRFSWHEMPGKNFDDSFIVYYNKGNVHLTDNDYTIINKLIKATGKGMLVEITSVKQGNTTYRKNLEKLLFEEKIKVNSNDIFSNFSLEDYMQVKYHAIKYGEL